MEKSSSSKAARTHTHIHSALRSAERKRIGQKDRSPFSGMHCLYNAFLCSPDPEFEAFPNVPISLSIISRPRLKWNRSFVYIEVSDCFRLCRRLIFRIHTYIHARRPSRDRMISAAFSFVFNVDMRRRKLE